MQPTFIMFKCSYFSNFNYNKQATDDNTLHVFQDMSLVQFALISSKLFTFILLIAYISLHSLRLRWKTKNRHTFYSKPRNIMLVKQDRFTCYIHNLCTSFFSDKQIYIILQTTCIIMIFLKEYFDDLIA